MMNANDEMNRRLRRLRVIGTCIFVVGLGLVAWGIYAHVDRSNRFEQIQTLLQLYKQTGQKAYLDQAQPLIEVQHDGFNPWVMIGFGTWLAMFACVFFFPRWFFKERFIFRKRPTMNDGGAVN